MSSKNGLSFDNLKVAFASKSDKELRNDYFLFTALGQRWLVGLAPAVSNAVTKFKLPVKRIIRATVFKHFCGGEYIEDCNQTIAHLYQYNIGSILDYAVEGKGREEDFDKTTREIIATIKRAKGDPAIPFCVFKPTGLSRMDLMEQVSKKAELTAEEIAEYGRVKQRVKEICSAASAEGVRLFIDAEDSWIQPAIDSMIEEMMQLYNREKAVIYNTVQLYRWDRLDYMHTLLKKAEEHNFYIGLKLVRGAYMEKERDRAAQLNYPSPIHKDKAGSDNDFNKALRFCVDYIDRISFCAGTHNENSSMLLVSLMGEKGIKKDDTRIWFSQLLGMSDHISFNLAHAGYNVCKYVPYGPVAAVLPYLTRRAQENTSIAGQMSRELSLIVAERKRRKQKG
ncbi:MAG: proline dehydrogenase family protein [Bacteroidia bacterium]|nr:proline dehydrogenase family protein [Bacteroidia bacterium]MCZ2278270.1 proline dehydrogenase family protein [Bacteroidia bacterium]